LKIKAKELQPGDVIWQNGLSQIGVGEGWYGPALSKVLVGDYLVLIETVNGGAITYSVEQELEVDRAGSAL